MKRTVVFILFFLISGGITMAQKYAFVDTEYILGNIPEYETAQNQLDELSKKWQTEIEGLYKEVEKMYNEYQADKVLLSEEMKKQRENEIIEKEREAKELQRKYFGQEGDLFKKRQELIKPIQDDIYDAVKQIAEEGNYAAIFDVAAGGISVLYFDTKYDISDEILSKMGYKN